MMAEQWSTEHQPNRIAVHQFKSQVIGDQIEITVATPLTYNERSDLPLPTVFVFDPFLSFNMVVGFTRLVGALSSGLFPQTLVVGVGYPAHNLGDSTPRRIRDFTPTVADFPPEMPGDPPKYGVGGAPKLLQSLVAEIIPGIQARYQVHSTDRTLIGWSLGGLFGLYALFHQPDAFARYLLVSPSIWWDESIAFAFEQSWSEQHRDLAARVFMCVGEHEETVGDIWQNEFSSSNALRRLRMISNVVELSKRLKGRAYPNLQFQQQIIPDEYHQTVFCEFWQ